MGSAIDLILESIAGGGQRWLPSSAFRALLLFGAFHLTSTLLAAAQQVLTTAVSAGISTFLAEHAVLGGRGVDVPDDDKAPDLFRDMSWWRGVPVFAIMAAVMMSLPLSVVRSISRMVKVGQS